MQQSEKKLTPQRALEVADSLVKEANLKKSVGNTNKKIAEAFIAKGKGDQSVLGKFREGMTAIERLEKSKKDLEASSKDSSNAARYRALALKAMKKK